MMQEDFASRLKALGREPTAETICLENTRLTDKYLIFDLIAVGSHSTIYYGIQEATGEERVFKFYNLKQIEIQSGFKEKEVCKRLSNYEYSEMKKCDSIHILKVYDIYEDRSSKIVVSEFCNMGSLQDEIQKRKRMGTDELKATAILRQIVSALKNIHKNCSILHKNLKARNILVQDGVYKLIDLGLPITLSHSTQEKEDNFLIPEIILKKDYDEKAEVWNVGVMFHQILYGETPDAFSFNSKKFLTSSAVKTIFMRGTSGFSSSVINFLEDCLQTDPSKRMTWHELENHSIFELIYPPPPSPIKNLKNDHKVYQNESPNRMSVIIAISEEDLYSQRFEEEFSYSYSQSQSYEIRIPEDVVEESFYSKKFNFERELVMIEKQLEEPYQKLGDYIEIKELEPVSWLPLRKYINKNEHIQYEKLRNYYLQCLKVDFIYYDIIAQLNEMEKLKEEREFVEFMYLLISRCFFEMSQLNVITKNNVFKSKSQNVLISCIKRQTAHLYSDVKRSWEKYSKLMEAQQNRIFNRFFDKVQSIFNEGIYKRKNQILTGIEGTDFEKSEQITYTVQLYEEKIKGLIIDSKYAFKREREEPKILTYVNKYSQIWKMASLSQAFLNIKQYIDSICNYSNENIGSQ